MFPGGGHDTQPIGSHGAASESQHPQLENDDFGYHWQGMAGSSEWVWHDGR